MTEADAIARYGLPPSTKDLPTIRALLADETARCRANIRTEPLLRLYCLMLFSRRDMVDAFLTTCMVPDAAEALEYLGKCEADFEAWTPLGHLSHWKQY